MTFLEAAIEVLRREGKPATGRQLVDLALKFNLLSVVGRDPEGTMVARLDDALSRRDHRLELIQLKPGLYGLKNYPPQPYPAPGAEPVVEAKVTNGESPAAKSDAAAGAPGGGRRRRSRRGRGGKRDVQPGAPGDDAETAEAEGDDSGGAEAGDESASAAAVGASGGQRAAASAAAIEASGDPRASAAAVEASGDQSGSAAAVDASGESGGEASAAPAANAEGAAGEKRGRRGRRRGGRGRHRREGGAGPAETGGAQAAGSDEGDEGDDETTRVAGAPAASARSRAVDINDPESVMEPGAVMTDPGPTEEGVDAADLAEGEEPAEGEDGDYDLPSGPLLAPSLGAEELTRSDEERSVRAEIPGRRSEERGRFRRGGRDRGRPQKAQGAGAPDRDASRQPDRDAPRAGDAPRDGQRGRDPRDAQRDRERDAQRDRERDMQRERESGPRDLDGPKPDGAPRPVTLVDGVLDILRSGDGRPIHVRQLTELVLKRRLVDGRGGPGEVTRQLRTALLRELRERETDGLRPRVRNLGGGQFMIADRKLDQELQPLERELADRAQRLREATRSALRRRLERLSPPGFEALGRALAEKLGVTGVELVRRGEGVAYFGGQRAVGVGAVRTLVALRPGEGEITRRAVGELRAGLQARGYDEGLLFAGGRAAGEALTELKAAPAVEVYDGAQLAALCIRHGLGVRRALMPIDYLDLDFLGELTEG